jgi:hypothetical protein
LYQQVRISIWMDNFDFYGYINFGLGQIGRIFAHGWMFTYFWQFFENNKSSPHFLGFFLPRLCVQCYKTRSGYILGDFFLNSSGHPVGQPETNYVGNLNVGVCHQTQNKLLFWVHRSEGCKQFFVFTPLSDKNLIKSERNGKLKA